MARCLDKGMCIYDVCLFYASCRDCVGVCSTICCVAGVVEDSVFFSLGVLKYVCVRDVMDALYIAMRVSFCLRYSVAVGVFIICRGLYACTAML